MNAKTVKAWLYALIALMAAALACGVLLAGMPRAHAAEHGYELDMSGAPTQTLCFAEVIGNDMLYQQNEPVSVWGFAPAGSKIDITLAEQSSGTVKQSVQAEARVQDHGDGRNDDGHGGTYPVRGAVSEQRSVQHGAERAVLFQCRRDPE